MTYEFTTVLKNILDLFNLIYDKFTQAAQFLFMPLAEFMVYVDENVGYIDIPDWFISLVNGTFGDVSLVAFMFGSAFALTILLSFAKWALDIVT